MPLSQTFLLGDALDMAPLGGEERLVERAPAHGVQRSLIRLSGLLEAALLRQGLGSIGLICLEFAFGSLDFINLSLTFHHICLSNGDYGATGQLLASEDRL